MTYRIQTGLAGSGRSTALLDMRVAVIKSPSDDIERSVRAVGGRERNYKYRRRPHGHSDGDHLSVEENSCIAEGIMAVFKVGAPVAFGLAVWRLTLT